jgi:hypothetical protein
MVTANIFLGVPAKPTGRANARPMTGSARTGTHNHQRQLFCEVVVIRFLSNNHGRGVWVPAFARTTKVDAAIRDLTQWSG